MKNLKTNNFVKKHQQKTGTGVHVSKNGKHSPRCKQKAGYSKDIKKYD